MLWIKMRLKEDIKILRFILNVSSVKVSSIGKPLRPIFKSLGMESKE